MSDLKRFQVLVDDIWELVFGTKRKPEKETKRKRARKKDGTYRSDDKSTPNINEAWENE